MINSQSTGRIPKLCISIVSHAHGSHIRGLLHDITHSIDVSFEIILTLNIPEDTSYLEDFDHLPIHIIQNSSPKGFGANHNFAFIKNRSPFFAVINPDIRSERFFIEPIIHELRRDHVAACAPLIVNQHGHHQDSIRKFPSPIGIVLRRLGLSKNTLTLFKANHTIDWAAGMFLVFKKEAYQEVGGFDERYFMYVEDVDICWRIREAGLEVRVVPECYFIHEGQYQSRRNLQHFLWHLKSYALFFAKFYGFIEAGTSPKRF